MEPEDKDEFDMEAGVAEIASGLGLGIEPDEPVDPVEPVVAASGVTAAQPSNVDIPVVRAAPKSWGKDFHEDWTKIPPKAQEYIELREKQMHEGLEQYKGDSGFGKAIREITTPYQALLASQGVDAPKAVQVLMNAHYKLSTLPMQERTNYFSSLARTYGIELPGAQPAQAEDPRYKALEERLNTVTSSLTQQEQRQYAAAREKTSAEVNKFAETHPYFDEVAGDIPTFIAAGASLDDAYDRAVWANPVTRVKETARLKTEAEKALREKSKQEAEAAKKARSTNVRSRDTTRAPTEPLGKMEDTMRETLKEINSRTH